MKPPGIPQIHVGALNNLWSPQPANSLLNSLSMRHVEMPKLDDRWKEFSSLRGRQIGRYYWNGPSVWAEAHHKVPQQDISAECKWERGRYVRGRDG